ncbi:longevity-assurance protein-like protein [Amniculicola lignicola CBS 123094]|uniref:Longevity-assurance protein-like protein n=1 Tax=Amniculicola lignicola CBS 123094 TaxID=1392246 RepID=A0A6A5WD40_9PLEO|nr:longevity-assurance protein-like protein [Amniculicola lignicola CBS 123094]
MSAAGASGPWPAASGAAHGENPNWAPENLKLAFDDSELTCRAPGVPRSKRKTPEESLLGLILSWICDHQIGISINLILLLTLTHISFPRARRRTSKFFHLSYYNPETDQYGCGTDDLPYVAFGVVVFTGVRVLVMDYVLDPLARMGGIKGKKNLTRFKEQAWLVCYCTCFWSLGMYISYNSDFWFNLKGMWTGWPFREISGLCKWYYLVQWAFWIQQILVVNIEEKRKDYTQMFTHHIVTIALLFFSYGYYHTRVGVVIMCLMDLVDIVLPSAKLLKYLGYTNACDVMFGLFVVVWFTTRHVFYSMVMWSVYAHAPAFMAPGCYLHNANPSSSTNSSLFVPMADTARFEALGGNDIWGNIVKAYTDREGTICWNPTIRYCFLGMLTGIEIFCILWFVMIMKIVVKVLSGGEAEDVRSDDEGEDEEEEIDEKDTPPTHISGHSLGNVKTGVEFSVPPLEEEVGVEALNFSRKSSPGIGKNSKRRANRSTGGIASGISIPGHGDRKELLGRIGCDKPS